MIKQPQQYRANRPSTDTLDLTNYDDLKQLEALKDFDEVLVSEVVYTQEQKKEPTQKPIISPERVQKVDDSLSQV